MPLRRILLVPGFCELPSLLLPLRYGLRRSAAVIDIWQDKIVARDLEQSVKRLRDELLQEQSQGGSVAVVTHSFGDWVVRQAIADLPVPPITALVSLAPIIAASPVAKLLQLIGFSRISEVPIMADAARSAANSTIDPRIQRMVIWASIDTWIQRIEFPSEVNVTVHCCVATHLSIVMQPNVHRRINDFLARMSD